MIRKSILILAGLLFVASAFFSCEDLLDVTEEFWLEHSFPVIDPGPDFNEVYILDASSESDLINDYGNKIKKIEILETTYEVTFHDGPPTQQINTATLTASDNTGGGVVEIGSVENKNLSALVGNVQTMDVNQAGVDRMAELIKNPPHVCRLDLYGSANEGPLNFAVKFRFKVRMVANPL